MHLMCVQLYENVLMICFYCVFASFKIKKSVYWIWCNPDSQLHVDVERLHKPGTSRYAKP